MTYNKFKNVVTFIYDECQKQKSYINALPSDVSTFIVCNEYSESWCKIYEKIIDEIFDENTMSEWIHWFIWQVTEEKPMLAIVNNREYNIGTLKEFLDFIGKEYYDIH